MTLECSEGYALNMTLWVAQLQTGSPPGCVSPGRRTAEMSGELESFAAFLT